MPFASLDGRWSLVTSAQPSPFLEPQKDLLMKWYGWVNFSSTKCRTAPERPLSQVKLKSGVLQGS